MILLFKRGDLYSHGLGDYLKGPDQLEISLRAEISGGLTDMQVISYKL